MWQRRENEWEREKSARERLMAEVSAYVCNIIYSRSAGAAFSSSCTVGGKNVPLWYEYCVMLGSVVSEIASPMNSTTASTVCQP